MQKLISLSVIFTLFFLSCKSEPDPVPAKLCLDYCVNKKNKPIRAYLDALLLT